MSDSKPPRNVRELLERARKSMNAITQHREAMQRTAERAATSTQIKRLREEDTR